MIDRDAENQFSGDNKKEVFQELPESTSAQKSKSFFSLFVHGIHIFSIAFALLGSIPFLIIAIPTICSYYLGTEPLNLSTWIDSILMFCHPCLCLPISLVLYLFGKGLGAFVKNERLLFAAKINEEIFGFCFVIVLFLIVIITAWNGGLSK